MKKAPECKLCGQRRSRDTGIARKRYRLYRCRDCSLGFLQPIPGDEELAAYYERYLDKRGYKYLNHELREYKISTVWRNRLQLMQTYGPSGNDVRILEVGTGTGEWVEALKRYGRWEYSYRGLEIAEDERTFMQEHYDVELHDVPFVDYYTDERFDVICFWDVLEHVQDLRANLRKLSNLLRKGGVATFTTINMDSYSFALCRDQWRYFTPPEHIYYFSPTAARSIVEYFPLSIQYLSTAHQYQSYIRGDGGTPYQPDSININLYRAKRAMETVPNLLFRQSGEIMTLLLKKE